MAVKFSQFNDAFPTGSTYLVGFDGTTNVRILYSSLLSGTTNYVSKWTSSTALGNSQIFDNGTSVGIGTTSPAARLDVTAANGEIRSTGTSSTYTQYNAFITSGVNMRIGAYATNNGYLGTTTNHPFTIETNNTQRARFFANGNLLIGSGTTDGGYLLDVNGSLRSTSSQFDNGAQVGKADNTSTYPTLGLRYASGSGADIQGYQGGSVSVKIRMQATNLYINTPGSMIFCNAVNETNESMRIVASTKNVLIGTTTDAGYKLDVNGTARVSGNTLLATSSGNVGIGTTSPTAKIEVIRTSANDVYLSGNSYAIYGYYQPSSLSNINYNGGVSGWLRAQNLGAIGGYSTAGVYGRLTIHASQYSYTTNHVWSGVISDVVISGTTATANRLSGLQSNLSVTTGCTVTDFRHVYLQSQPITGTVTNHWGIYQEAGTKNYFSGNVLIGTTTDAGYLLDVNGTARSVGATYLGTGGNIVTFGTATAQAGYRFTFNGGFIYSNSGIDVVDRISCGNAVDGSAILQAASTTKGFLPPRMTGAQAEAIASPAAGLLVYANNGNGATITSTGWWGYNGSGWVKLN